MKRTLVNSILILATGSLLFAGTAFAETKVIPTRTPGHPRVNQVERRQARQQTRINNGIANGSINRNEARRLERGQARVERHEQRMLANNNGHLTKSQQVRLNHQQNRQSRHIYHAKHNGR